MKQLAWKYDLNFEGIIEIQLKQWWDDRIILRVVANDNLENVNM